MRDDFAHWFLTELHAQPPDLRHGYQLRAAFEGLPGAPAMVFGRMTPPDAIVFAPTVMPALADAIARGEELFRERCRLELLAWGGDARILEGWFASDLVLGDPRSALAPLVTSDDPAVRRAIGAYFAKNACPELRELFEHRVIEEPDAQIACSLIDALGEIRDERSREAVVSALAREYELDLIVFSVARALAKLGAHEDVHALLTSQDEYYRLAAVVGLGADGASAHAARLLIALDDEDELVVQFAAQALGRCGVHDAAPRLLAMLECVRPDSRIRIGLVEGLGLLCAPELVEHLGAIVANAEDPARGAAAWAAHQLAYDVSAHHRVLPDATLEQLLAIEPYVADFADTAQALAWLRDQYRPVRNGLDDGLARPVYVPTSIGKRCLRELSNVPWAQLPHGSGLRAPHTPALLRASTSDDEHDRSYAARELAAVLCDQGTLFIQTAHAVPFLIALCESHDAPWVEPIQKLLRLIHASAEHGNDPIAAKVREAFDACEELVARINDDRLQP